MSSSWQPPQVPPGQPQQPGGILGGVSQAVGDLTGGAIGGTGEILGGVVGALHDIASPTPTVIGSPPAESGTTTSEFKMTAVKSFILGLFALCAAFGIIIPTNVQGIVLTVCPLAIGILGAAYSISRGLRKRGTA